MNRRTFVSMLLGGVALAPLGIGESVVGAVQGSTAAPVNVVDAFGFVPDGRTDNYEAFMRWASHVNAARGGHYVFPPGAYYVHRYLDLASSSLAPGSTRNAYVHDADGLTITGYGARILLNGAFHRGPGEEGRNKRIFMPFDFWRCRNLRLAGFEVDGGVRSMTRDLSTGEIYGHLVALNGCVNAWLEDLDLHHSPADGLYLYNGVHDATQRGAACRNINLNRVTCRNNARGALAPLQVNGLLATDCSFSETGNDLGRYIAHAPTFGVDVEPDFTGDRIDIKTGNLEFRRCRFEGNGSAFLAGYVQRYTGYLRIIDCISGNSRRGSEHMIICWPGAVIQGGVHDTGVGTIWTGWQNERGGDLVIRDTEIRGSGPYALFHGFDGNLLRLERTRLVGRHRDPGTHGWVLAIHADPGGGRRNRMTGCEVFLPARRHSPDHNYDYEVTLRNTIAQGNVFRTDLAARDNRHFAIDYGPNTQVRGDRFRGSAPGPADSIRPIHNNTHDTRLPYSQG